MTIPILIENLEAFARLNFIRDQTQLGESTRESTWRSMKQIYLEEAESAQVQEGYVLTLDEVKEIQSALKR